MHQDFMPPDNGASRRYRSSLPVWASGGEWLAL